MSPPLGVPTSKFNVSGRLSLPRYSIFFIQLREEQEMHKLTQKPKICQLIIPSGLRLENPFKIQNYPKQTGYFTLNNFFKAKLIFSKKERLGEYLTIFSTYA